MGYIFQNQWTGNHSVYTLRAGGKYEFNNMENMQEIHPKYLNTSLVKIYRYKEPSAVIEQEVKSIVIGFGVGGVILVCSACAVTMANPPAAVCYGAYAAGGCGATMEVVAGIAAVTAPLYAFHEFVIFECSDGYYLSIEKNKQHVSVQISQEWDKIIHYKDGVEHMRDPQIKERQSSDVRYNEQNRRFTVKDVLAEAVATPEYSNRSCNCHHFAGHLMNKFAVTVARPAGCAGFK